MGNSAEAGSLLGVTVAQLISRRREESKGQRGGAQTEGFPQTSQATLERMHAFMVHRDFRKPSHVHVALDCTRLRTFSRWQGRLLESFLFLVLAWASLKYHETILKWAYAVK